jgi:hypothetical protein
MCRCRSQHNHRRSSCRTLTPPSPPRVDCCSASGSRRAHPSLMWPRPWPSRGAAPLRGGTAISSLEQRASMTVPAGQSPRRGGPRSRSKSGSVGSAGPTSSDPIAWVDAWGWLPSTVRRVLVRHDLNRLSHIDRQSGREIRCYERERPGELVHVDVKKLGKIPPGGGHKVRGRQATRPGKERQGRVGFAYVTPPSTTTLDWPTQKSSATRPGPPVQAFGGGPRRSFGPAALSSSGS